jgi:hypothetical protein
MVLLFAIFFYLFFVQRQRQYVDFIILLDEIGRVERIIARERNVESLTWDVITTIDRRQSQVEPISGCACPAGAALRFLSLLERQSSSLGGPAAL